MGQSTAETLIEIEQTRDRLEDDLTLLEQRLPAPAVLAKRVVGVAVGGGAAGTAFWFVVRRARAKRRTARGEPEIRVTRRSGGMFTLAIAIAGLLVRIATLREVRRLNAQAAVDGSLPSRL